MHNLKYNFIYFFSLFQLHRRSLSVGAGTPKAKKSKSKIHAVPRRAKSLSPGKTPAKSPKATKKAPAKKKVKTPTKKAAAKKGKSPAKGKDAKKESNQEGQIPSC